MPHLTLEISSNIIERPPPSELLTKLQQVLSDPGPFQIVDMKSRMVVHENYVVADGSEDKAFIHLQVAILSGRAAEVKKQASQRLLQCLKDSFASSLQQLNCSVTVEIRELDKECYSKEIIGQL